MNGSFEHAFGTRVGDFHIQHAGIERDDLPAAAALLVPAFACTIVIRPALLTTSLWVAVNGSRFP